MKNEIRKKIMGFYIVWGLSAWPWDFFLFNVVAWWNELVYSVLNMTSTLEGSHGLHVHRFNSTDFILLVRRFIASSKMYKNNGFELLHLLHILAMNGDPVYRQIWPIVRCFARRGDFYILANIDFLIFWRRCRHRHWHLVTEP